MGYAGYVPAKSPPSKRKGLQAALALIESMDTLETLGKLVKNIAVNPTEEKFRRIRLNNKKIQDLVVQQAGGLESLLAMGWVYDENDSDSLVVPKNAHLNMAQVRSIEDAKDLLKRDSRTAARLKMAKESLNPEQKQLLQQLEADRRERAAREPITRGSVAQPLPSQAADGPRIMTGKDSGFGSEDCPDC